MNFDGKVVLVTGGGGGVGGAAARLAAMRGARVVVTDAKLSAAQDVAATIRTAGGECVAIGGDVSQAADVQAYVRFALDSFGTIDCFLNNAGILGPVANIVDYDEAQFDRIFAINTKGVFLGMKYVLPVMIAQRRGTIVNTSSLSASLASPGMTPYAATKSAILSLTAGAAGEVGRLGIRVNAICPGSIPTGILDELKSKMSAEDSAAQDARYQSVIPTGRYSTAEEVANLALFLLSDLSGNINASSYVIDGGRHAVSAAFSAGADKR